MTFIDIYLYVDMHDDHHMYTIINITIIMNISVNNDRYIYIHMFINIYL